MKNIITKTLTVAVLAGAIAFTGCQTGWNSGQPLQMHPIGAGSGRHAQQRA